MVTWTPALVNTLVGIVGVVIVSVVAVGTYLSGQQRGWKDLAEQRGGEIEDWRRRFDAAVADGKKERDFLSLRIDALEAQLAEVQRSSTEKLGLADRTIEQMQRLNHRLQVQLDALPGGK